ncbi:MAG TPA: right-handed parallel beta-helix repeat-containing protein [Pyrinomonadaceae bacterium]
MIRQLVINNFPRNGIVVTGLATGVRGGLPTQSNTTPAMRNRILGCFIGTDVTGEFAEQNRSSGITLTGGANSNFVGGILPAERNVISGNGQDGIYIHSGPGDNVTNGSNLVQGNYIGTNKEGTAALSERGNGGHGIRIGSDAELGACCSQFNTISGNLISGNSGSGVVISGMNVTQNTVRSNLIGTDFRGRFAVPNGGDGVTFGRATQRNLVTGAMSGAPSVIAFNRGHGIRINGGSTRNSILATSIFRNLGGGITLESAQAGEEYSNHLQLAPTLTSVEVNYDPLLRESRIQISGTIGGISHRFTLEFFANERFESPQGRTILGTVDVTTDAAGNFRRGFRLPGNFTNSKFTSTATSFLGDTSAFSQAIVRINPAEYTIGP